MTMNLKSLLQGALVLSVSVLLLSQDVLAQGTTRAKKKDTEETANQIDAGTGKILLAAYEFINKNQIPQARAALADLKMDKLSPYERAQAERMFISLDVTEEKYDSARKHMQAAIASGGLNEKEVSDMRYQMAQLLVQEEKWKEGAAAIEDWLKTAKAPNGSVYYLLGVCYYSMDNLDSAIPNMKKAVDSTDKPLESWLATYGSLLLQKERYKEALPVMERLVNGYPNQKKYWTQLSQLYSNLDDNKNALVVMQLANDAGLLTQGDELQRLADLMSYADMPYSAAVFMQKGMDDKKIVTDQKAWQRLGAFYTNAKEWKKAIAALEKSAQMSDSGNDYLQLGGLNMQLSQWDAAVVALEKAVSKGGLRDVDSARFNIGYALYNLKKYPEALSWLEKVPPTGASGKNAKSFIQLINTKMR